MPFSAGFSDLPGSTGSANSTVATGIANVPGNDKPSASVATGAGAGSASSSSSSSRSSGNSHTLGGMSWTAASLLVLSLGSGILMVYL